MNKGDINNLKVSKCVEIPKQLHNPDLRFVLLGKWDDITYDKNKKPKYKGKIPFEKQWEKNGYCFNDIKILNHIEKGLNFGVIGGYGRLRILDIDNPELAEEIEKKLQTYTVKTGSGGRHFYFYSDYDTNHTLTNKQGELRAVNSQVVSAPCRHPSGNYYTVVNDKPIVEISKEDLLKLIEPYLKKELKGVEMIRESKEDNKEKDTSRSGKEMKEICKLVGKKLSKEEVFREMEIYSRWSSSSDDYKERTYKNAVEWVEKNKNNGDNWIRYLLEQDKPIFKSLGCGLHNNFMYFGTKIYNGTWGMDAIVTSEGKVFVNSYNPNTEQGENQINKIGIKYRYPFLDSILDYCWSNNSSEYSINSFLFGKRKEVTLKECFQDILKNNREFMDYPEDIIHISISCDILSSFFLPLFEAKGRAFFNAEKGSGKTRQSTLYDLQMFNPIMSSDMSGSSYFRTIESTSASIIIDDFDDIGEDKKPSQIQVMRTGYKLGSKTVRCSDKGGREPQPFAVFNSMVINNIGGLDEVTSDRCNIYFLIKSISKSKADKKLNDKDKKWTIQRDKCYYSALLNWKLVKETYENLKVDNVIGRDLEKISPILTIGKLVLNDKDYEKLVDYEISRIKDVNMRDVSEDWLFLSMQKVIEKITPNTDKVDVRLDEIVKSIINIPEYIMYGDNRVPNKDYPKLKHSISVYLGKIFKNTPLFKSGKEHGGFIKYTFTREGILKFLTIRNYLDFFPKSTIELLNQPIQPILPIPPIQPIQPIQDIKNKNNNNQHNTNSCGEVGEVGEGGYDVQKVDNDFREVLK